VTHPPNNVVEAVTHFKHAVLSVQTWMDKTIHPDEPKTAKAGVGLPLQCVRDVALPCCQAFVRIRSAVISLSSDLPTHPALGDVLGSIAAR
jgi:hypothetical protein